MMTKAKFGKIDSTGKVTITHEIDLSKVKSPDPLACMPMVSCKDRAERKYPKTRIWHQNTSGDGKTVIKK